MKKLSVITALLSLGLASSAQASVKVDNKNVVTTPGGVVRVVAQTSDASVCDAVVDGQKVSVASSAGASTTYAFRVQSSAKAATHKLTIACDGEKTVKVKVTVKGSGKKSGLTKKLLAASALTGQRLALANVTSSQGDITDEEEAAYIKWLVDTMDENDPDYLQEKAAIEQIVASVSDDDPTYLEEKAYIERIVAWR